MILHDGETRLRYLISSTVFALKDPELRPGLRAFLAKERKK